MPESTTTQTTNKRKRGTVDDPSHRPAPGYKASDEVQPYVEDTAMNQLSAFNEGQQNGGANAAASDTAAAALQVHYPIAGDASFQTQGSTGGYADTGYELNQPGSDDAPQMSPGGTTSSKPQVGSEEWHKIRKDNHKEGKRI